MDKNNFPPGFYDMIQFPFLNALLGRRSRRFYMGAEIPDGVFSYKSSQSTLPLSELEKILILSSCAGNTSWHHMIYRAQNYAPFLPNYAASAAGRVFPSSAGFHTSMTFFTDDQGVYVYNNRDSENPNERDYDGNIELEDIIKNVSANIVKLQPQRLSLPPQPPYTEPHNTWVANHPGSLLIIPVGDLAQHVLLNLCYMLQNGVVAYDNINKRPIPGISEFDSIVNTENTWSISFIEQWSLSELTVELATSCYAGTLMLQAMGLGGWMFNGLDSFSVLGASADSDIPGLGFHYTTNNNWPYPNVTGLPGIMEGFCPPHFANMRDAVEAVCDRKFGPGGPFNKKTPGPWKNSEAVRSAAQFHNETFRRCVALQAQYIFDCFGKFPGTVPSIFCIMYLQAHHLDLDFYDKFYHKGAYLRTHADHLRNWHST